MHNFIGTYRLILQLIKKDFKQRFIGSYLGFWWAFIQPVITICIFWFVFQVGFKSQPVDNVPFVLWLVTGMLPWFFISESVSGGTYSIMENSHLVKKIVFKVSILPIVKILSALVVHIFFMIVLLCIYLYYNIYPNIYWLQLFYYIGASIIIVTAVTYINSAIVIFFRDLGAIIGVLLQIGFWITPIFWNINMIPEKYITLIKLNPAYYIIEGYRGSLIYNTPFYSDFWNMIYFWCVTIALSILGIVIFRKLKPHFADVL